jgi:hypothetical protein
MAKERRAPPYMRWDQRGRPVLQATLKLPDGTAFRAMLNRTISARSQCDVCSSSSCCWCPMGAFPEIVGPHSSMGGVGARRR